MAIIQFPRQEPLPTFGGAMGTAVGGGLAGLGQGLSSGIENLINIKLQNLQRQQRMTALSDSFKALEKQGILDKGESASLASMAIESPQAANLLLRDKMRQAENRRFAEQQNLARGMVPGLAPDAMPTQPGQVGAPREAVAAPYQYDPNLTPMQNIEMEKMHEARQIAAEKQKYRAEEAAAKMSFEREKLMEKKIGRTRKETEKLREVIDDERKLARSQMPNLKKALALVKRGKMDNPIAKQFLDKIGLNLEAWKRGDTKEFEALMDKIRMSAPKDIKGRATQYVFDALERTLPNIFQSPKQQERLLANAMETLSTPIVRAKIKDQLMKEFSGKPLPDDFSGLIEERMEPHYNKIMGEFSDLAQTAPPVEAAPMTPEITPTAVPPTPAPPTPPVAPTPEPVAPQVAAPKVEAPKPAPPKPKKPVAPKMSEQEKQAEGWFDYIGRQIGRTVTKAGASALGFPGDMINLGKSLIEYAGKKITGKDIKLPAPTIPIPGLAPFTNPALYGIGRLLGIKMPTGIPVPTSKGVERTIKDLGGVFGGKHTKAEIERMLTPQNKIEALTDNIVSDVAPMLMFPISGVGTGIAKGTRMASRLGKTALRGLKISGLSNLAGTLAEEVGMGKTAAGAVRLGTVLALGLKDVGSLRKMIKKGVNPQLEREILMDRVKAVTKGKSFDWKKFDAKQILLNELNDANRIRNAIGDTLNMRGKNPLAKMVFASLFGPQKAAIAWGVGKGLSGIGAVDATMRMLSKYPTLRKSYVDLVRSAARGNARLMIKNANNINEILEKKAKKKR